MQSTLRLCVIAAIGCASSVTTAFVPPSPSSSILRDSTSSLDAFPRFWKKDGDDAKTGEGATSPLSNTEEATATEIVIGMGEGSTTGETVTLSEGADITAKAIEAGMKDFEEEDKKDLEEKEEELSETKKLLAQVKEAGLAGVISYALWEMGFWALSVPVCAVGYYEVTGHWPDLSNSDDQAKLAAEAFAFVNFARFAVPLRIGLALSTTPWIKENIVDRFQKEEEEK
jgi:hypothetical protein